MVRGNSAATSLKMIWKNLYSVKCYDKVNMNVFTLSLLGNFWWGLIYFDQFICFVFVMLSNLFIAALWLPAVKGLTSWLSCVWCFTVFCHFPMWCPGSGVVLDCIDSWSLPSFLLWSVIVVFSDQIEPWYVISNNLVFLQVKTQTGLCSLLLILETPTDVQSVA